MKVGRRLAIKILNASKFALASAEPTGAITAEVDRAMVRTLAALVAEATEAFEAYDYARVLQRTETFFWGFCDDYLELVKGRRYGEQGVDGAASANAALTAALSVMLRLFAPFLPFVTEEVWSWWRDGSIHVAPWPTAEELHALLADNSRRRAQADERAYQWATDVLFEVRKQRSEAKQPLKVPITKVTVKAAAARISTADARRRSRPSLGAARAGVRAVGRRAARSSCRAEAATRGADEPTGSARPDALPRHRPPRARGRRRCRRRDDRRDRVADQPARGVFLVKADCVLAGLDIAIEAFRQLDPGIASAWRGSATVTPAAPARRSPRCSEAPARCSSASGPR